MELAQFLGQLLGGLTGILFAGAIISIHHRLKYGKSLWK
jgi:hypothetical protein